MDKSLLLVDDEETILRSLKRIFRRAGYLVTTANSPDDALRILERQSFPVVLSDFRMSHKTGGELLIEVKAKYPETLGLILSGYADLESVIAALNSGAVYKFLEKPWDETELLDEVEKAFNHWSNKQQLLPKYGHQNSTQLSQGKEIDISAMEAGLAVNSKQCERAALMRNIESQLNSQSVFSLIYLDIRYFRHFNYSFGYKKSDELLQHIAMILQQHKYPSAEICPIDRASFLVLVPESLSDQSGSDFIEQLLAPFKQLVSFDDREVLITFSAGFSVAPEDGGDAEALIRAAQLAANSSKGKGFYDYPRYQKNMDSCRYDMVSLQSDLCHALKREEFSLYYQPKISLVTGEILGAEALIRWQHGQKGMISPDRFIPLAELTGLIGPIGEWVLSTATEQSQFWQEEGLPKFIMSVNVSGRQLIEHDLAEKVNTIIQRSGLSPELLELEVTETFLMQDIDHSIGVLQQVKALGVKIAIDDFGTGYSSLNYLTRLPADTLKVDRSFVSALSEKTEKNSLVKNMITMSHDLGLRVVAEGVETVEQLDCLQQMNCDEVQGYYFSPPLTATKFKKLLQDASRGNFALLNSSSVA